LSTNRDRAVVLSVVVPATDAPRTLPRCIAAIRAASTSTDELIVVDQPAHAGPANARNRGAEQAHSDIVVFIDADVAVAPDALRRIRDLFEREQDLAAAFGSYDDAPEDLGLVSSFRNLLHHHVHQRGAGSASTFWAGLGAVRLDDFKEIGGFDDSRFDGPSVEDIEFGMRLAERGGRILLDPTIQGKHLKRWTLRSMLDTDFRRRGIPWVQLLIERRRSSAALNLGWRERTSAASCLILVGALARRRWGLAAASATTAVALNGSFYVLLRRRGGWKLAFAGIPLHLLHYLVSAAAVPAGAAAHIHDRFNRPSARSA
jgi:glycosyltransferase involved in cell wall biosynthesis